MKKQKDLLVSIILKFLIFTGGFMALSTFIYILSENDKWISRLSLAILCLGFSAIIKKLNHISATNRNSNQNIENINNA